MDDRSFGVIAWNSAAPLMPQSHMSYKYPEEFLLYAGEKVYGQNNSFSIDIRFIAKRPGFIVQEITRRVHSDGVDLLTPRHYYEVFFIDPATKVEHEGNIFYLSHNADAFRFGGPEAEKLLKGTYIHTGLSKFYPYTPPDNLPIKFTKDKMNRDDRLTEIFGRNVVFHNDNDKTLVADVYEFAAGLPVAVNEPVVNLPALPSNNIILKRVVEITWDTTIVPNEQGTLEEKFSYLYNGIEVSNFNIIREDVENLSDQEIYDRAVLLIDSYYYRVWKKKPRESATQYANRRAKDIAKLKSQNPSQGKDPAFAKEFLTEIVGIDLGKKGGGKLKTYKKKFKRNSKQRKTKNKKKKRIKTY